MFNTTVTGGPDAADPREIDWPTRMGRAVIGFDLDASGLPLNPMEPYLPAGRGELWHWGEAVAADAIVRNTDADGFRELLMIERDDDHGYALPGGGLDEDETPLAAVVRELAEETGLALSPTAFRMDRARYVPDPRAGRHAWMVTVPGVAALHMATPPAVVGTDDARRALWLPAGSYAELEAAVRARGGKVFAAHQAMLHDLLEPAAV
ncbi:NUDIX hydrolase [Glycomyces sp. A-F 0318]|uniref:NUDIX hydrolase n=1 Tax=Glycomyces amatae TaxID=2881355 RepID=UPI001E578702|nr:NUDIX hydrolase [Glycomyces amatae]MCD0442480.1 NUDIX hydrolase [Glycomyces amatae]